MSYQQLYEELEIIGQGSFGSAYLVRNKETQQLEVAKKIILKNMNENEVQSALKEVKVLKQLKDPNIVEYKGSFLEQGQLVILMEYCEEGDLQFHIKKRKAGLECNYFPEKLILNWFIQLLKVLHRDIKTSNIFLTSNGTVKLGDFGVSKVLENTLDHASTVAGTPYYMSPEVCENKPYTFKSDVWALGCVLYEICTFKHAFDAKNLLGLIYKILKDQAETIPNIYSKDLQNLIVKLLSKEAKNRPIISDIMELPFIKQTMLDFINNAQTQPLNVGVKKTKQHSIQQLEVIQNNLEDTDITIKTLVEETFVQNQSRITDQTVQSINYNNTQFTQQSQLTPKEIQKLKKEIQIQQRQSILNQAIKEKEQQKRDITLRKIQNQHGTGSNFYKSMKEQYENQENNQTLIQESKFIPLKQEQQKNPFKIVKQQIEEEYPDDFEDVYPDDFEDYEQDFRIRIADESIQCRLTARQSAKDLQNIIEVYKNELNKVKQEDKLQDIEEENESHSSSFYKSDQQFQPQTNKVIENLRESILKEISLDQFKKVYDLIKQSFLDNYLFQNLATIKINLNCWKEQNKCLFQY
ncbi:hypothetical protein pb186bvf_012697 [Paramecium bursaria]